MAEFIPEDLIVETPVIQTRWRLHDHALPLKDRHMRAFGQRGLSVGLMSWMRQHIEWTLAEGTMGEPDGVLVTSIDEIGRAMMKAEPYVALEAMTIAQLRDRLAPAAADAIEQEVLWAVTPGGLVVFCDEAKPLSGANSLIADLAATTGRAVVRVAHDAPLPGGMTETFMVSDEHGVVSASDAAGPVGAQMSAYHARLVGMAKPDQYDRMNLGLF